MVQKYLISGTSVQKNTNIEIRIDKWKVSTDSYFYLKKKKNKQKMKVDAGN